MNQKDASDAIVKEIVIRAPAERVFEALVDPRQRVEWWTAAGRFQATHMESDLRPGGAWLLSGAGADGSQFTVRGEYRSIERPRLLEFTWLPSWQEEAALTFVRFELEEKEGFTTVRLTHYGHTTERSRESHRGWPQLLAGLQAYLEKKDTN